MYSLGPVHTGDKVKSNSTQSILSLRQSRPNDLRTFDIWATILRQKSSAFDKVDRVEHVQLWRQCRPQQAVTFDFVASYDSWPIQPDILSPPLLRLTSRKNSSPVMTVGQSSLIYLAHHCCD